MFPPYASFHEVVSEGLLHIPKGLTVMVLSRNETPPLLDAPYVPNRFTFMGWHELRFTFSEAAEFVQQKKGDLFDKQALLCLYAKTDGWIAGLLPILESLGEKAIDYQLLDRLSFEEVFDYFAEEIFAGTDRETQEFLLKTALTPGLTITMAEQLTGIRSSERILPRLTRNHFFTVKRSEADPVYQYHPLFRDFLLARANKTLTSEEASLVRRKAASLLEKAGRTEDAAGLFIEAADWEGIRRLILHSVPAMLVEQGRSEVVRARIESLPCQMIENDPDLLYWQGACLLPVNPTESSHSFQISFDLFTAKKDRLGMLLSWSGGMGVCLYTSEYTPMDKWLSYLHLLQVEEAAFPTPEIEARVVMSIFNVMSFRQPNHSDIANWVERAFKLMQGSSDIDFRVQTGVFLVAYYLWNGNLAGATFIIKKMQELPT